MFPPVQCSKSSYFTQWLISEYLNRINGENGGPPPPFPLPSTISNASNNTTTSSSSSSSSSSTTSSSSPQKELVTQSPALPPQPPPPPPTREHSKHLFPKHLNLFFGSHHNSSPSHKHSPTKSNNNEYKNGSSPDSIHIPKNIEFIQLLALNALEFTAPIYSFINKKEEKKKEAEVITTATTTTKQDESCKCPSTRSFVQLSGHPGSFAPAGPNTVWKKMPEEQGCGAPVCCARSSYVVRDKQCGTLKEVLQELDSLDHPSSPPPHSPSSEQQQAPLIQHKCLQESSGKHATTPITVFFKTQEPTSSSTTAPSSPSSLLPPQIYHIPTHILPNEVQVYRRVTSAVPPDPLTNVIPKYVTETCYNSQMFLELEDLLTNFSQPNPTIMDIKLGTRTFLESEVKNSKPRPDLYDKLIAVDPTACTDAEHAEKAVTKLTYMLFREKQSSSTALGFRVEGIKIGENGKYEPDHQLQVNFKCMRCEQQIADVFTRFCKGDKRLLSSCLKRLELIRDTLERSDFFSMHEVIGSSLLFIHDDITLGIWMIDFAKTFNVDTKLTHREPWLMGNREDGVLTGVDNIVRIFKSICAKNS